MIRKETREVFITTDGKEFETSLDALKHSIRCALTGTEKVFLQSYQIDPIIAALLDRFTITPINPETQEI